MPVPNVVDTPVRTQTGFSVAPGLRPYFYLAPLVLGPLLILVAALLVLPTQWFARKSHDAWLSGVGYGAKLRGANCQVVIYGDSTGEVGINPGVIRERTGLSTCDISQVEGLLVMSGNFVLDQYLAHNAPPRVLVFLYAPEDFNPETARRQHAAFEAITYHLQQPHKRAILLELARNPESFFKWSYKGISITLQNLFDKPDPEAGQTVRERTGGQLFLDGAMMGEQCSSSKNNLPPDKAMIQNLRTRYARPGMALLVNVMPLPACDPGSSVIRTQFEGLVDNQVGQLPSKFYYRGGRHVNADGAVALSNMLADQILAQTTLAAAAERQ